MDWYNAKNTATVQYDTFLVLKHFKVDFSLK